jgi:hypothetical protein
MTDQKLDCLSPTSQGEWEAEREGYIEGNRPALDHYNAAQEAARNRNQEQPE